MSSPHWWAAAAAFGLIGVLAFTTLEGKFRQAVLILIVGLAVRLVIGRLIERQSAAPPAPQKPESH